MHPVDLPIPGEKRIAVRVTRDAQRQIRGGHPWLFDGSIESVSHDGAPGDLAVIFDQNRKFLAIGLWDPHSPIRVRILHRGSPRQIDDDFWLTQLSVAIDLRAPLTGGDATTAYRVVNGENDGFPGLVADRYASALVLKLYSEAWLPHLRPLVEVLVGLLDLETLIVRLSRNMQGALAARGIDDGVALVGAAPEEPVLFKENGLTFEADIVRGQKTGHFLDQRDNRALVGGLADGARVLDVFACTGGFSVHAAAGGASEVVSVDQSRPALDTAVRNMAHYSAVPAVAACRHSVSAGDAFEVMEQLIARGERFDVVVIDPPAFAKRQRDVPRALQAYQRLTSLGLDLVNDGDWLVQASCSSRISTDVFVESVHGAAGRAGVELMDTIVTGHPIDHPVGFPEGAYLKAVFGRPRR